MKFNLIICTYMRPGAIMDLLDTVLVQTSYPNEILVVDASLNDDTKNTIHKVTIPNLKYIKVGDEDRGLTKQRNVGIKHTSSEIEVVCFLDDDILLKPDYFEHLLATYQNYPDALAVGGYITNEVLWVSDHETLMGNLFVYDGFKRKESSRFVLRKKLRLVDDTPPGFMPEFSNGRSVSFLPPSGKTYTVEQIMGGVASYKKEIFKTLSFSKYFEGYGLYEDADFSLRIAKLGKLYLNTKACCTHHHNAAGRPNKYTYGKMVVRNGWYVWRVKHQKPTLNGWLKWHALAWLQLLIRFGNVITTPKRKEAFTEALGRLVGWMSLFVNKPKI